MVFSSCFEFGHVVLDLFSPLPTRSPPRKPIITSRREEKQPNKRQTNDQTKSFSAVRRRSVLSSPRSRSIAASAAAPRLSLATASTGTVLLPSQMSQIAGHDERDREREREEKEMKEIKPEYNWRFSFRQDWLHSLPHLFLFLPSQGPELQQTQISSDGFVVKVYRTVYLVSMLANMYVPINYAQSRLFGVCSKAAQSVLVVPISGPVPYNGPKDLYSAMDR